ncbi:DPP IV N-terminal domain-containing protein [Leptolyngbya sp. 15MV]|nr:DPP IV N-terminal domain-containing protein [Leptolyngbya sp. 15MV]
MPRLNSRCVCNPLAILAAAGLAGLPGCASKQDAPPQGQPSAPQASRPVTVDPLAVSSAGLVANRPMDLTATAAASGRLASPRVFRPSTNQPSRPTAPTTPAEPPAAASAAAVQTPSSTPKIQLSAAPTTRPAPTSAATEFYGQVMARSMAGASDPARAARGASVNVQQVTFSMEGADFDPDISADGSTIVFSSTQHRPTADIYIKSVTGRTVTQLTTDPGNDIMPRLSPDGTRIAFASNRSGPWNIYVMPVGGGRAIQITATGADDLHPSWSPDGRQLVFSRLGAVSGQWEMWVTDVANQGAAKFIGYGLFPAWSPVRGTGPTGGDLIAFQKSRERGDRLFSIWTIEVKDGQAQNPTEIASSTAAACINPSWSRDGQWLAFATVADAAAWAASPGARPAQADLWMIDLAGTSRINLTSGLALNLMPRFGPDNRLFFVSDRGGVDNVWAMDASARRP